MGLETENNMIVSGRADLLKQEQPINYEIEKIVGDITKIQDSLKSRAASRDK